MKIGKVKKQVTNWLLGFAIVLVSVNFPMFTIVANAVTGIAYPYGNGYFIDDNGIYYQKLTEDKVSVYSSKLDMCVGDVVIPEKICVDNTEYIVSKVGKMAFWLNSNLTGIALPDTIETVETMAFQGTGLKNIVFPASVKEVYGSVFDSCTGLETITFEGPSVTINASFLKGCTSVKQINVPCNTVEGYQNQIGLSAYKDSIKGVHNFVKDEVQDCWKCTFCGEEKTNKCGDNAYWRLDIEEGTLYIEGEGATDDFIETNAPWITLAENIQKIELAETITKIGAGNFLNCGKLKTVNLSGITDLGDEAFRNCPSLEKVVLSCGKADLFNETIFDASVCGKEGVLQLLHTYVNGVCSECSVCQAFAENGAHDLKTTITKATFTENGKKETKCSVCKKVTESKKIYAATTVKLSKTKYTYNGEGKHPTVIVKDSKDNAIATSNYTVSYDSGRKNVGKYTVKVTFKEKYKGSKALTFTIYPKGTTLQSVTPAYKAFTATWSKQTKQVDGYEIQYALDKAFTIDAKKVAVTKDTTTTKKISNLKAKKTYYVRIRTYKMVGTKKYCSDWSKIVSVKTK